MGVVEPPPAVRRAAPRARREERIERLPFEVRGRTRLLATRILERAALAPGERLQGPAVLVEADTTILVPPDFQARLRGQGGVWLEPAPSVRRGRA